MWGPNAQRRYHATGHCAYRPSVIYLIVNKLLSLPLSLSPSRWFLGEQPLAGQVVLHRVWLTLSATARRRRGDEDRRSTEDHRIPKPPPACLLLVNLEADLDRGILQRTQAFSPQQQSKGPGDGKKLGAWGQGWAGPRRAGAQSVSSDKTGARWFSV